ncbi:MAG: hypothetical protein KAH32_03350 [Chlamydiia bacterium]|nr:hypothetical protein [Chlamydiia bacterium]
MKKLLLGLGAATSVIAPIAAVVACGDTDAAAKPVVKNLVIAKRFGHTGAAMTEIREIATLAAGSTISINGHKSAILTTEQLKELKVAGTNTGTQKKHDRKKGYFVVLLKLIQTGDSTATIQDITIPKVKITSTSDAIAQKADILALVAGDVIKDGVSAIHHDYVVLEGKDITALSGATGTDDAFKAAVKAITDRGRGTVTVTIVGDTIAVADSQRDMKGMKIIRKIAALVKGDKIIYKGTTTTLTEAEVNGLASAGASGTQHMGSKNANA